MVLRTFTHDGLGVRQNNPSQLNMTRLLVWLVALFVPCCSIRSSNLVDLSYTFDQTTIGFPIETPFRFNITRKGYTEEGYWLQTEEISMGTHWGTHIDAPCHMSRGRWTLSEIPLSRLVAPAAVVDISHRARADPDALLEVADLRDWEELTGYSLDHTVVLVRAGWGSRWPDEEEYVGNDERDVTRLSFPGISPEAASWLVENRRIYGIGLDTLSLDSGANQATEPAHQILLGANIYGLENLANLDKLPLAGAQLYVSPMKLGNGACGSPTRIIAVVP